jgi:hypothetical protein
MRHLLGRPLKRISLYYHSYVLPLLGQAWSSGRRACCGRWGLRRAIHQDGRAAVALGCSFFGNFCFCFLGFAVNFFELSHQGPFPESSALDSLTVESTAPLHSRVFVGFSRPGEWKKKDNRELTQGRIAQAERLLLCQQQKFKDGRGRRCSVGGGIV